MDMKKLALMGLVGLTGTVPAKTVALWPMETGLNCPVDTRLQLAMDVTTASLSTTAPSGSRGLPWAIPPNPDTAPHLAEELNSSALWSTVNAANKMASVTDRGLANAVCSTSDFTIEGWINVQQIPDSNGWYILVNALGGSGAPGGWIWSMRRQSRSQYFTDFELYVREGMGDTCLGGKWFEEPETQLVGQWMHVALTHVWKNADGKSEWNMYTNGVRYAQATHNAAAKQTPTNCALEFGGRSGNTGQRFRGGFDYWRVSDRVLAPEEFLCAGGEGSPAPVAEKPTTAFYWKLDRREDGTVDTTPQVGRVALGGGYLEKGVDGPGRYIGSSACAFEGQPPNTTVTLPRANAGSFYASENSHYLRFPGLGSELEIDRAFTVEGWFKPERSSADTGVVQYLFNTRMEGNGWALGLQSNNEKTAWYLQLFVQQVDAAKTTLVGNANLSPAMEDWVDWKHVALTYDPADGNGVWRCYLDGVLAGTTENRAAPTAGTGSETFHIGGRPNTVTTFNGYVDCVRVSRGALDPRQLLCEAADPQAVPDVDVLGFWPLDSVRGVYPFSEDVAGTYPVQPLSDQVWAAKYLAGTVEDAPVVTNPDPTPGFAGSPTNLAGSAAFNMPANGNASRSHLMTYSLNVCNFFRNTRPGWTAECYVKRTAGTPSNWELLFGLCNNMTLAATGMHLNFTYRSYGFVLFDNGVCASIGDEQFPDSTGADLPAGEWAHVALEFCIREIDGVEKGVYEVFVNGVSKGRIVKAKINPYSNPKVFTVGGRLNSDSSFKGSISSLRISRRALDPSEFLCAASAAPSPRTAETVAFWPLESDGTSVDLGDRLGTGAWISETHGMTGSAEAAKPRVPRAAFDGDTRANAGSAVLAGGQARMVVPYLGLRADMAEAFTLEGWLKWSGAETASRRDIVAGTYRPGMGKGWKLYIDSTGATPCVRLYAGVGYPYSPLVADAVVVPDASDWRGAWKHLALVYDPRAGATGTWTLWVDGRVAGAAANLWAPQGVVAGTDLLGLGLIPHGLAYAYDSAEGGYDMWRLSAGALTKDEFLFAQPNGSAIFVR